MNWPGSAILTAGTEIAAGRGVLVRGPQRSYDNIGGREMSEPTYGSGSSYETGGQGYGGQPPGYGGQPPGGPPQGGQPAYGQQYGQQYPPQTGPASGGYPAAGYPSQGAPLPTPSAPRTPADKVALAAAVVTIVGYVCAIAGVFAFILLLTIDAVSGIARFAAGLQALIIGIGLGGLNFAAGTWLTSKAPSSGPSSGLR
jgi:hypothetical protein